MLKDQLYRISRSQFYEWLFGPEKFSGLSRNGPQERKQKMFGFYFLKKLWGCVGGRVGFHWVLSNELITVELPS